MKIVKKTQTYINYLLLLLFIILLIVLYLYFNVYEKFISNSNKMTSQDIITGEKLQNICDYYIGNKDDLNFNPSIKIQTHKHIFIDDESSYSNIVNLNIKNIFCYTHILADNNKLIVLLKNINTPFNILFHNSDHEFNNNHINLLNIPNLKKIYTQNINILPNDRLIPLPIGIANSMWGHGNLSIWDDVLNNVNFDNKRNNIYFNFSFTTGSRKEVFDIVKSKNIENISNLDYKSYLELLSSYKFCICPEGNGIDTHRFWECLYLKVIPICKKNYVTEYYSKLFPTVLLDNWQDFDTTILDDFYKNADWLNYNQLSFETLKHTILNS